MIPLYFAVGLLTVFFPDATLNGYRTVRREGNRAEGAEVGTATRSDRPVLFGRIRAIQVIDTSLNFPVPRSDFLVVVDFKFLELDSDTHVGTIKRRTRNSVAYRDVSFVPGEPEGPADPQLECPSQYKRMISANRLLAMTWQSSFH
jgi:hypothetical protein